ncbi:beta-ketoacyl-ACP synthase III [Pontivivens insulae]|uniref:Beta-ketoacyl-[acyl-carrier-protein] synthase III n=1 Tax=Pontivivens insulae TaxID=1639689 RepID=A0A2R8ACE3_9RHOB|nr:beta-ketoacyl-ACP synthase III [Pontivivens insulae]RED13827.1 3-oxoacyl-[acyl-carrier-protein] synthase III [Pontivivens insulae]SPF29901.1 3-oxoacyl-[acyl-carrier-protein] synthase 3 [Pontivivens insulae]
MTVIRAVPIGTGHYLPERVVENAWFTERLETTDEWIRTRSGIERRHFAAEGQKTSDLAIEAARAALADTGLQGSDIDAIVLATATPDQTFPSTATRVQHAIGMTSGYAFDLQAVCAGFIFALANANALIVSGQARRVMVIGAETFSRILDWEDRATCVLFGDGAGALILEAREGEGTSTDQGILSTDLHSDGQFNDLLYVDGGVSSTGTVGVLKMQGREVFKHAVSKLTAAGHAAMEKAGVTSDEVSAVVPHQANLRIIKAVAQKMNLTDDRIVITVQDHGNTSAASIPLAMSVARTSGRVKAGDLVLMEAIGGGLAWGAALMRW